MSLTWSTQSRKPAAYSSRNLVIVVRVQATMEFSRQTYHRFADRRDHVVYKSGCYNGYSHDNGRSNVNVRSNLVAFAGCAAKPFPEVCYLIKRVAVEGTER